MDASGAPLAEGAIWDRGVFFRNQEQARARFGDESFGHTLDPQAYKWRWVEEDVLGLSVNLVECVCSAECSVRLHPDSTRYHYVVQIVLEDLSAALEIGLVAKYSPIPASTARVANPCHFDILPVDDSLDDVVQNIKYALKKLYVGLDKKPGNDAARRAAQSQAQRIEALLKVIPVQLDAA